MCREIVSEVRICRRPDASPQPSPVRRSLVERVRSLSNGGAVMPPPARPDATEQVIILSVTVLTGQTCSCRQECRHSPHSDMMRSCFKCSANTVQAASASTAPSPGAAVSQESSLGMGNIDALLTPPTEEEAAELTRLRGQLERQLVRRINVLCDHEVTLAYLIRMKSGCRTALWLFTHRMRL